MIYIILAILLIMQIVNIIIIKNLKFDIYLLKKAVEMLSKEIDKKE